MQVYRQFKRRCVFSHEQLLCEIAEKADDVNIRVAMAVHDDLRVAVDNEAKLREAVKVLLLHALVDGWMDRWMDG